MFQSQEMVIQQMNPASNTKVLAALLAAIVSVALVRQPVLALRHIHLIPPPGQSSKMPSRYLNGLTAPYPIVRHNCGYTYDVRVALAVDRSPFCIYATVDVRPVPVRHIAPRN